MTIHIALLRAVNVGRRKPIIMGELRDLLKKGLAPKAQLAIGTPF